MELSKISTGPSRIYLEVGMCYFVFVFPLAFLSFSFASVSPLFFRIGHADPS